MMANEAPFFSLEEQTPWNVRPHAPKQLSQELPRNGLVLSRPLSPLPSSSDKKDQEIARDIVVRRSTSPPPKRRKRTRSRWQEDGSADKGPSPRSPPRRERSRSPATGPPPSSPSRRSRTRSRSRSRSLSVSPPRSPEIRPRADPAALARQLLARAPGKTGVSSDALVELLGRADATRAVGTLSRDGEIEVDPEPFLRHGQGMRIRLRPAAEDEDGDEPTWAGPTGVVRIGAPLWTCLWHGQMTVPDQMPFCVQIDQATWRPPPSRGHPAPSWTTATQVNLDLGRSTLQLSKPRRTEVSMTSRRWTTSCLGLAWRPTTSSGGGAVDPPWAVPDSKTCSRHAGQPIWASWFHGAMDPKAASFVVQLDRPKVVADGLPWKRGERLQSVTIDFALSRCRVVALDQSVHTWLLALVLYHVV